VKKRLKVGIVDFLNSRPLAWGFLEGTLEDVFEASYHPPSRVADLLRDGAIDIGLVPSIEAARIVGATIIPGTCVAATREVRSVLLLLRRPLAALTRVSLDANSRTSVALLRILCADLWGIAPELIERPASPAGVDSGFDGALLIGDPALKVDRSSFEVVDLAAAWNQLTGRPFVFALWAAAPGVAVDGLNVEFRRSLEQARAQLDRLVAEAAAEQNLGRAEVHSYLTENLSFDLGPEELGGLREFYRRATEHGLLAAASAASALSCLPPDDPVEFDS